MADAVVSIVLVGLLVSFGVGMFAGSLLNISITIGKKDYRL